MSSAQLEKKIRKYVYDVFYTTTHGPVLENIMKEFNLNRSDCRKILNQLHNDHLLVVDKKTDNIIMAHPFTNLSTPFIVELNNSKKYFGGCAWDAIAFHFMLKQPISISSKCYYCNSDINLNLKNNKIIKKDPDSLIIFISKPLKFWWDDVIDTCFNHIKYYCSKDHLQLQQGKDSNLKGEIISDQQISSFSQFLYSEKLDINYTRPTTKELEIKLNEIGLIGSFWNL